MPTGATVGTGIDGNNSGRNKSRETGSKEAAPTIPFIRASFPHLEPVATVNSNALGASSQNAGVTEITSYGYMRSIILKVTATGGDDTAGSVAFSENGPFNVLQEIILSEPNGATIVHLNDGYQLYLANKFGGYRRHNDARTRLTIDETAGAGGGDFSFMLRIPVEISQRDALGSLPNQNAASAFQLKFRFADADTVYSTAPEETNPSVQVDVFLEAWAQPMGSNPHGGMNQTTPPAMNTTQYWSVQQYTVNNGKNKIRLNRVGNYLRNVLFLFEDTENGTAGTDLRADGQTNFPSEDFTLWLDSTPIEQNLDKDVWLERINERYGYAGTADGDESPENGVFPYDFCHEFDGAVGHELRDGWLLTNTSSRLEIEGTFGASGVLRVLTNDVTIAGNVFL
jgi:hypothetical protein